VLRKRQPKGRVASEQAGDPAAALAAAATLLARRDFCSIELGAKLSAQGFEPDSVRSALEQLIERRYLDDERYARQFVAIRAERGHGPLRIRRDLAELGLQAALIDAQLESHGEWPELARRVLSRRFGPQPPRSWPVKARQMRFLQYRGFSNDQIRCALGADTIADFGTEPETDLDTDS
jgi:regulatory protein